MAWKPGAKLVHRAQRGWGVGVVVQVADDGRRLAVRFSGRPGITVVAGRDPALEEMPPDTPLDRPAPGGPVEVLAAGEGGPASAFRLRARVARLEALRRADSLGALLSSRVHVLPHQVGAAGRILADRIPRFVLADEVGLGKTIEAGLVFAGLRQLGIAERVLVLVPDHLAFQWLAELFHKFNAVFTLLSAERVAELGGPVEALRRCPLAIVSHERLLADAELARAAADLPADLAIVDEAHHVDEDPLFEAVTPIARAAFGLLLLTATPVRLDPREYHRLLSLVEPVASTSLEAFLRRLEDHEAYAEVARGLLGGGDVKDALARLRKLAPDDLAFAASGRRGRRRGEQEGTRESLLGYLADRYSLSARLIRNRRVKVGAFTRRMLHREDVPAGRKSDAAVALCARLAGEKEKVLVFGGDLDSLRDLRAAIAEKGRREALLYDDASTLEARDRLVARFRDPDGPMILLSGESGGEGRNFQFASHLVCYDLPPSPLVLEQRIGRLDRLGQTRPVEIHVLAEPGEEAFLADLYEKEIGIFDEPVGGLDPVLASLPAELAALQGSAPEAREAFRRALAARVAEGRRAQHEGYDPLLDIRSASIPELTALVRGAFRRLGEPPPEGAVTEAIEHALQTLSRSLEEELEEEVVEIARRAGIEADTDENVHPFEVAFTLGAEMKIEALPGMAIPEEARTHLGSFWRETAVARDELEWFATGHRLVEALLGLARDGDAGRAAALRASFAPRRGGLYLRFALAWPSPADVDPGARVPSRQASRYLDGAPVSLVVDLEKAGGADERLAARLEEELESIEEARVPPPAAVALGRALAAGTRAAGAVLAHRKDEALAQLRDHASAEEGRLETAGRTGGAPREAVEGALAALHRHRAATEQALASVALELDAAALLVP
jgi:ATP-dependent helicase HepA